MNEYGCIPAVTRLCGCMATSSTTTAAMMDIASHCRCCRVLGYDQSDM